MGRKLLTSYRQIENLRFKDKLLIGSSEYTVLDVDSLSKEVRLESKFRDRRCWTFDELIKKHSWKV